LSKGNNQLEANEIEIEFIKKLPEIIDFNPVNNSKKMISAENPVSSGTLDLNFPGNSKKILPTENDMIKSKLSNFPQVESISSQNQEKCSSFQNILGLFGIKMNFEGLRSVWNISSVNEEKISKFLKEREADIIDFHRKYLTRIYPSGKRVDSSNYDPIDAFNCGAQLIALNVQTADISLLIYFSKFMENGGNSSGYVLKPSFLLSNATDIKYIKDFKNVRKILNIKIISGQQLRPEDENDVQDVADPYVEVFLRGSDRDEADNPKTFKSIMVKNNGFNPIFDLQCTFKISCPELCVIGFKVFDQEGGLKKDMRLGWYAIPFPCIREGYRIIPLLNSNLKTIEFSCLFSYISIKELN